MGPSPSFAVLLSSLSIVVRHSVLKITHLLQNVTYGG